MTTPAASQDSPQDGRPVGGCSRLIRVCRPAALALIIVLGTFYFTACGKAPLPLEASAQANGLRLTVATAQREWQAGSPADVSVTFTNLGEKPVVVLQHCCRLEFKGPDAQYAPYPMPPLSPWTKAQALAPGKSMTTTFSKLTVWEGKWDVKPGTYEVRAAMSVSNKTIKAPAGPAGSPVKVPKPAGQVWKGEIRTDPIGIVVRKK